MNKSTLILAIAFLTFMFAACDNNKIKPAANSITKQAVTVNGKKDSVINNVKRNYGNATVSEPCVRCLIEALQATAEYKNSVAGIPVNDITYNINWVKGQGNADTVNTKSATNALKIVPVIKGNRPGKPVYFLYDNSAGKLFAVAGYKKLTKVDDMSLKRIRNACYWGVASGN